MQQRRRVKQTEPLIDRLRKRAAELRGLANWILPGDHQVDLLKKAEQCESALMIDGWLRSQELTSPS